MSILSLFGWGFGSIYALWIFYLAVMNLKRARDTVGLTKVATVLGFPVLIFGYALDCLVNIVILSILLVEIPRETTVTARLQRHAKGSGWRKKVAVWFAFNLLDAFDPSGKHI